MKVGIELSKNYGLYLILAAALLFRLILSFYGVHPDILSQANWGVWIAKNGPLGFYDFGHWIYEWPSQPPLVNFLYAYSVEAHQNINWLLSSAGVFIATHHLGAGHLLFYFDFVRWFGTALFSPTDILIGQIVIIKWFAIFADIFLGLLLYKILILHYSLKKSLILTTLFLFLPFGWYLSALWGQYDQIGALFFVMALLLLFKRYFVLSCLILFLAFQVKPTIILFLPFYLFYFFLQKPNIKNVIFSFIALLIFNVVITLPFIGQNQVLNNIYAIYEKTFFLRRGATIVNHSFNFWGVFFPLGKTVKPTDWIFIIGNLLILSFNLWAIFVVKQKNNLKQLLVAAYIVAAGSYIFGSGMLDRYFFTAVIILGLNLAFFPKLIIPWILCCLLFSFNLFYSWGFPLWTFGHTWDNTLLIRVLSLAQLTLFIVCINIMLKRQIMIRLR